MKRIRLCVFFLVAGALSSCIGEPLHDDVYYRFFGPDPDEPVYMKHPEDGKTSVCGPYLDSKIPDWKASKLIADCVELNKRRGYVKISRPS
jgi:hypothetical protein